MKKLHAEAAYFGLYKLELVIASQMCVSFLGHESFQEE
jgi:hypothetical protein